MHSSSAMTWFERERWFRQQSICFSAGMKQYGIQGFLYFNGAGWTLSQPTISTLKSLTP